MIVLFCQDILYTNETYNYDPRQHKHTVSLNAHSCIDYLVEWTHKFGILVISADIYTMCLTTIDSNTPPESS